MLHNTHDLIHKAVGWMLREAGKRDRTELRSFLTDHGYTMPRVMLRYAIKKIPETLRKSYLRFVEIKKERYFLKKSLLFGGERASMARGVSKEAKNKGGLLSKRNSWGWLLKSAEFLNINDAWDILSFLYL